MYMAIFSHLTLLHENMSFKTSAGNSGIGLSVFSDGVLHFLQIKKKFYLFYRNYLVALSVTIPLVVAQDL